MPDMIAGGSAATSLRNLRRLRRDDSGLALVEFALTVPLVIAVGCWGVELSYLALTNMRV
jgi:Flp pilus assembly protein TadG